MNQLAHNIFYDRRPGLAVIADCARVRADATALAKTVGARLIGAFPVAGAERALAEDGALIDAVLLDAADAGAQVLDGVFGRLDMAAREGRHASVVRLPAHLIDHAAAHAPHADVTLLIDADERSAARALGDTLARVRGADPRLGERERHPLRLRQLSEEVGRIARTLAALSAQDERRPGEMRDTAPAEAPTAAAVRAVIRARRLREQFFDGELFADPAWDMLLDLMAARLERRHVAVSSLCIAAAVPPTTALRWMKQLTDDGLFVRVADPRDGRRVFIELSDEAAAGMSAYFQALARAGVAVA